jgi:4'-phosphopantetheinyl transferase
MTTRLWWVRPETFQASPAALALLSDEERAQHQRYIPPAKRHEYLVTRVLVRRVLGEAPGVAPQALQFVRNEWGCPALAPDSSSAPIHFNISHTDGLVVCLVSTQYEVGVDTELFSRAPNLLALAPDVFAPKELRELAALPDNEKAQRAVILWTLKESYIKARGMGLALPLDGFAFRFDAGRVRLEVEPALQDDGTRWQFKWQRLGVHCISTAIACPDTKPVAVEELEYSGSCG